MELFDADDEAGVHDELVVVIASGLPEPAALVDEAVGKEQPRHLRYSALQKDYVAYLDAIGRLCSGIGGGLLGATSETSGPLRRAGRGTPSRAPGRRVAVAHRHSSLQ